MLEVKEKNVGFIIVTVTLLLLVLLCSGIFCLTKLFDKDEGKVEETQVMNCDVSVTYYVKWFNLIEQNIEISDAENKELNQLLGRLEFSSVHDGVTDSKYILNYCDETLVVGRDITATKNGDTRDITKGYEALLEFLDKKLEEQSGVFLFKDDSIAGNGLHYKGIDILEEDKKKVRELWEKQDKEVQFIQLAIAGEYVLAIDNQVFGIDENTWYVAYEDGYVLLDKEIQDILSKYMDKKVAYTINNQMNSSNSKYNERGVYYDTLNHPDAPHYYTIASGLKNTGGYGIEIIHVNVTGDDVEVIVKESLPNKEDMVTMAITYPVCQIVFDILPSNIVFKTESGEVLKHINF